MRLIDSVKRISFAAIALSALLFSSCTPEKEAEKASVSVDPTEINVNYYAHEKDVTVTSSEDWTLVGDYNWVRPSTVSGADGGKVTFSIDANTTGKPRTATFTFKVTEVDANLTIKQEGGELEMNMDLTAVSGGETEVALTLDVESKDISLFNKWGVIYSLTDNKEEGIELELDGTPAEGTKEITVTDLQTNTTYYFWAYAEDISGTRHYTETAVEMATETIDPTPGEGEGEGEEEGDGELVEPTSYSDMKHNSIAITWSNNDAVNNLSAITMEALFRWYGNNPEEGIDTMFGIEGSWLVRCFNNFHWIPADGWFVGTQDGEFCYAQFVRESGAITGWNGMTPNVWHHFAFTYDTATKTVTVYIDGEEVATNEKSITTVNLYNPDLEFPTFHIGKSYNDTRWFNGDMAEVRIWSRALSASEINAAGHFNSVDPSTATGLLAYWKLGGTGTHVEDYSGNGHHGTAATAF